MYNIDYQFIDKNYDEMKQEFLDFINQTNQDCF